MSHQDNNDKRGVYVSNDPCTVCSSSDAMGIYRKTDRSGSEFFYGKCFKCGHYEENPPGYIRTAQTMKEESGSHNISGIESSQRGPFGVMPAPHPTTPRYTSLPSNTPKIDYVQEFNTYPIRAFPERKLSREAAERYNVRSSLSPQDGETIITRMYPRTKRGKITGYAERFVDPKSFINRGDVSETELFGQSVVKAGGKLLIITEGQEDCLAVYDALKASSNIPDWEPPVVSVNNGAASAFREVSLNFDYVNSFDKIVLCMDQDDPGQAAVDDLCKLLAGKVYITTLSEKDANAMLMEGKGTELKWEILKHAKQYTPDSIVDYADCWDRYKNARNKVSFAFPEEWEGLNDMIYGSREGELITITSGSGSGKTQFLRELKKHYHDTTDLKFADIALEEDIGDSLAGLMSLYLNKRIHLPDVEVTPEEEQEAFEYFTKDHRWRGYDHFGGLDDDNLFSKIRFFAATGHKMIFLDHLSIIVSEFAANGDERQRIDTIMTKLAKLAKELSIIMFLVVHLVKTSNGQAFEEGATPSVDDLRGSGSIKQLSSTVLALSRNQQHPDRYCANTSKVTVLKCRFTGRTGTAGYLHFQDVTGRMIAVTKPTNYEMDRKAAKTFGAVSSARF